MPTLFQKTFAHNGIPCEVAVELEETGIHRVLVFVGGSSEDIMQATDVNLETVLGTAEKRARHLVERGIAVPDHTEPERIRLLRRLGYSESTQ